MNGTAIGHASEAADAFWSRRVFRPSELDRAVDEYNAIHEVVNRLFWGRCLPVGRLNLVRSDWYAAGELASHARRLSEFVVEQRLILLAEERRLLSR